jgi:signal transduction histidine kinase
MVVTTPKEETISSIVKAKEELNKALSSIEQLPPFDPQNTAFVAHLLNNHLTVLSGAAELLQLTLKDYPNKEVHLWLSGMRRVCDLMAHLTPKLINVQSSEEYELRLEKVNLALLVERACNFYRRIAEAKLITLSFEAPAEGAFAWTDRVAVAATLDNLLSNAIKFSEPGGMVWVRIKMEPEHLLCSVRDEGPGLSSDDLGKLFQKGVRLSAQPTMGEPSSGYGLAVAKTLVDKLGGAIWCESEMGRGSSFWIKLPRFQESLLLFTATV